MAVPTGTKTTYLLTTGVKLDFEDAVFLISPYDVPLQGTSDAAGRSALPTGIATEKKVEWQDETLLIARTTLRTTIRRLDTSVVVATGDGTKFQAGDLIIIDSEVIRVSSVSTDTLTVVRAYGLTTAALHTSAAIMIGLGQALPEGSDPEPTRAIDRTNRFNYTQIFGPIAVQTSGSEDAVQKYGLSGTEFDHQVANRMKEMSVSLEQDLLYGVRAEDTSNFWRSMGGLEYWITTNVDSSTTTLTETALLNSLQACFDAGGAPDRIVTGSRQKRVISNFNASLIRYANQDMLRGQIVESYDSDFGRQAVILDRWCHPNDLFIFNRDQAELVTLRPMQFEMLAKTGDSTKGQVLMEKSFKFKRQQHASRFSALT